MDQQYVVVVTNMEQTKLLRIVGPFASSDVAENWIIIYGNDKEFQRPMPLTSRYSPAATGGTIEPARGCVESCWGGKHSSLCPNYRG